MSATNHYQHLEPRPASLYRQLFIKGTRIRADIIYGAHINAEEGRTPEQLAVDYGLPLEAVREAIEYCKSDPPEIAADYAREERLMEASGMNHPDYKYNPKAHYKPLTPEEWNRLVQG